MKEKVAISMDINKNELLKMLNAYYTETLGKDVDLQVNVIKELIGDCKTEHYEPDLEFYFDNEYNVGLGKVKITSTLSKNDIKEALDNIVGKLNYEIISIDYKTVTDVSKVVYFEGIQLQLN